MISATVTIANRLGLHARAAAKLVQVANQFEADVSVGQGTSRVNGKSILGLLTLAASHGSQLELVCRGTDEREALDSLTALIRSGFGESE